MKAHLHPKTGKPVSAQRLQQLGLQSKGLCVQFCGRPARPSKRLCRECALKALQRKHPGQIVKLSEHPSRLAWAAVDWSQKSSVIAKQLGVVRQAVDRQRRKLAKRPPIS